MKFFRDILDGPLYIIVALLSLIFIMAIIGFLMERKRLEKEEKARIVYVNNSVDVPIEPVQTKVEEINVNPVTSSNVTTVSTIPVNSNSVVNEQIPAQQDSNPSLLVKTPVVVFDDPDKKE